jgi:hypothetical protein
MARSASILRGGVIMNMLDDERNPIFGQLFNKIHGKVCTRISIQDIHISFIVPKKMVDEAIQTIRETVSHRDIEEMRDTQLRLAARRQAPPPRGIPKYKNYFQHFIDRAKSYGILQRRSSIDQ